MHRPLLIVGMHRSGTSCLAGQLEQSGIWLGDVRRSSVYNPKGNRENPEIMALNEAVLVENGGAWDMVPDRPIIWSSACQEQRDRILATYPANRVWGFKDPRTLITLEGWRAVLPDALFVGTVRHPIAVASSLYARNNMPIEKGVALWTQYNKRLLNLVQREEFPIVSFDMPASQYISATAALIAQLGLSPPTVENIFFEENMRNQAMDAAVKLPEETALIYDALNERALK